MQVFRGAAPDRRRAYPPSILYLKAGHRFERSLPHILIEFYENLRHSQQRAGYNGFPLLNRVNPCAGLFPTFERRKATLRGWPSLSTTLLTTSCTHISMRQCLLGWPSPRCFGPLNRVLPLAWLLLQGSAVEVDLNTQASRQIRWGGVPSSVAATEIPISKLEGVPGSASPIGSLN